MNMRSNYGFNVLFDGALIGTNGGINGQSWMK